MTTPFHTITATQDTPLFIFGDHASRHIPAELNNLGLSGDDLTRHIAWDIGTETIIRHLCDHFGCAGHLAGFSRLVADPNRDPSMIDIVPQESDGTVITGNQGLTYTQRAARIAAYHEPYHAALSEALDKQTDPLVISLHSFTPKPKNGDFRMTDIGVLVKHDEPSAEQFQEMFMRLGRAFVIGMNEPYSAHDLNYTIDRHVAPRGFRHLAIEVRQDHINTEDGAIDIAKVLADRLEPIVNRADIAIIKP